MCMAVTLPLQNPKSGSLLSLLEVSCKKLDSKGSLKTLIGVGWVDNHLKKSEQSGLSHFLEERQCRAEVVSDGSPRLPEGWGGQRDRKQKPHYTSGRQQRHKVNPTVDKQNTRKASCCPVRDL